MSNTITIIIVIAAIIVLAIGIFMLVRSLGRIRVMIAVMQATSLFKLRRLDGSHPDLDAVWIASRGEILGIHVTLIGGPSHNTDTLSKSVNIPTIIIQASFPKPIPFHLKIQQRPEVIRPKFQTGDKAFDNAISVEMTSEIAVRPLMDNASVRRAILGLLGPAASGSITTTQCLIKTLNVGKTIPLLRETVNLVRLIAKHSVVPAKSHSEGPRPG